MTDIVDGHLREWRDVMLRLQQLTRNDQGASVLKIQILCIRGQPAYWFEPEKKRVEPAAGAQAFCDLFDGAGTA
jgi:hypothetical protein